MMNFTLLSKGILNSLKIASLLKDIDSLSKDLKKEVYLVGGIVRDFILGMVKENEMDIAVEGDVKVFGEELARRISGSFFCLDKKRSLFRVVLKKGEEFVQIDIVGFREGMIEEDLLLRDFTVNSLAVKLKDILEEKEVSVIDPSEGIKDIQNKIIRVKDEKILEDDPLRLLRGIRFLTLGFHLEERTEKFIKAKSHLIKTVSPERIKEELFKIFLFPKSSYFIQKLYKLNLLEFLFQEIKSLENISIGEGKRYNLWKHSLNTLIFLEEIFDSLEFLFPHYFDWLKVHLKEEVEANISKKEIAKFCALFHDIGKPKTMTEDNQGNRRFFEHEKVGAEIGKNFGLGLKMSNRSVDSIKKIILNHLRPLHMSKAEKLSERAFFRFFKDIGKEGVEVCLIALADAKATLKEGRDLNNTDVSGVIDRLFDYYLNRYIKFEEKPLIRGKDLINLYGIKPGPIFGEILREIQEARGSGIIIDRNEALKYIEEIFGIGQIR